jgi:hypothetical protein
VRLAERGLHDPGGLREHLRHGSAGRGQESPATRPAQGSPPPDPSPAPGSGVGPAATQAPVTGGSYGPSPCPDGDCTPQDHDWESPGPHGSHTPDPQGDKHDPGLEATHEPEDCNGCGQGPGPEATQAPADGSHESPGGPDHNPDHAGEPDPGDSGHDGGDHGGGHP